MVKVGAERPALLARCLDGDHTAWQELIERYHPFCLRTATAALGTHHRSLADDVVQETWLIVFRGLNGWRGRTEWSFQGWLRRILTREAARVRAKHPGWVSWDAAFPMGRPKHPVTDKEVELRDGLHAACRSLTGRQRQVMSFVMRGDRPPWIAAALGISPTAVRRDLGAVRRRVSKSLAICSD